MSTYDNLMADVITRRDTRRGGDREAAKLAGMTISEFDADTTAPDQCQDEPGAIPAAPSETVKYLGLRLTSNGWAAMLDFGNGPNGWDRAYVAHAIASRVYNKQPIPQGFQDALADLQNLYTRRDVLMYEDVNVQTAAAAPAGEGEESDVV